MAKRDIVVIGASAGGVEALKRLCQGLPADFPAAVFIVQHLAPEGQSLLPGILQRCSPLPVFAAKDGEPVLPGRITVGVPDRHLLLRDGVALLRRGPEENRSRPAINALFRSAAVAYGGRVIGVVLTGLLDDGADGLIVIKKAGGISVVQDPADAEWPSMPQNAINNDHVDHILPLAAMPGQLAILVGEDAGASPPLPNEVLTEALIAERDMGMTLEPATPGKPSVLSCPQCGGVLNEIDAGGQIRFRCQVGHGFTPDGLAEAQRSGLEYALAVAIRTHRDRLKLFQQMKQSAENRRLRHAASRWSDAIGEAEHLIQILEHAIADLNKPRSES
jgi:two-component system chemotaxis response regulator CheB